MLKNHQLQKRLGLRDTAPKNDVIVPNFVIFFLDNKEMNFIYLLYMTSNTNTEIQKQIDEYKEKLVAKGMYGNVFDVLSLCGSIARRIIIHEQDVSSIRNNKVEPVPHEEFLKLIKLIGLFYIMYKKFFEKYGLFDIVDD